MRKIKSSIDIKSLNAGTEHIPIKFDRVQLEILKELQNKECELIIQEKVKPRSLNANAYLWEICDLIAQKVGNDRDTIYQDMLFKYGTFTIVSIKSSIVDEATFWIIAFYSKMK